MRIHRIIVTLCLVLALPGLAAAQGILMPKEPGLGPFGIGHQRVTTEIRDGTAVTKVDQTFVNHTNRILEGTYIFPLPKGAALEDFALWIGGKKTKGEILDKDQARSIYEGIVRRLEDPALLEYIDHDLFRARVFPIPARGQMRIEISFSQVLQFDDGVYTYRYPLGASKITGAASKRTLKDFTFTATITSKRAIKTVYSPSHQVEVRRNDDHSANIGFEHLRDELDRDLVLYYTIGRGDVGINMLSYADGEEPGYFLMMISPKQEWQKDEVIGKTITFVIDTSGSMARKKLKAAQQALTYCLARLHPKDRFNIVRFSTSVEQFRKKPVEASPDQVRRAKRFVNDFYSSGGTAIHDALTTALEDAAHTNGSPHLIVFLTDGEPTVGVTDPARIAADIKAKNGGKSRIFVFGVGEELNSILLDRIAAESDAQVEYAADGKETEMKLSGFYNKIAFPVLTDVELDLEAPRAFDVYPRTAPALFKGSQLIVLGRYRETGKQKVSLSGKAGSTRKTFSEKISFPKQTTEHDFIPRLWAVRKVGYLLEAIRLNGEQKELKDEVTQLGKKFGIVTPYTSYLVVEDTPLARNRPRPSTPVPDFARRRGRSKPRGSAGPGARRPMRAPPPSMKFDLGAAPAASAEPASEALAGRGFANSSGKDAVLASRMLKKLKESKTVAPGARNIRTAGAKTFFWNDGVWVDTAFESKQKVLKVKYLSDAYFELLKVRPELKAALALGKRVVIAIGKNKAVEIGPTGEENAKQVKRFLK